MGAVLRGRDHERALLAADVDAARSGCGRTVILRGDRGAGRTALLDEVARQAGESMLVLSIVGVPTEAGMPFAAIHQLLRLLDRWSGALPEPQAAALRTVFGVDDAEFDPYRISLSVLSLLSCAAAERPLLVLVDDADQLAPESARTLAFAARRLANEPIAILVATTRDDGRRHGTSDWCGLPELTLTPLCPAAAAELVADHYPGLTTSVVERLVAEADGNPQLLIELGDALPAQVRHGRQPLPEHIAPGGRLGRALIGRFDGLPPDTRTALQVVAAENSGTLAIVLSATRALGLDDSALAPAISAGLVVIDEGRIRCVPSVLAAIAYHASPLPERLRAHEALVRALANDRARQVRHQAECLLGVDEHLAEDMAAIGHSHRRAGDAETAVDVLYRAAMLTGDAVRRARYLLDAAESAWLAGNPQWMTALLESAAPLGQEPVALARIALLRGLREHGDGSPSVAYRILVDGAGLVRTEWPELADRMLDTAQHSAWLCNDLDGLATASALRVALPTPSPHRQAPDERPDPAVSLYALDIPAQQPIDPLPSLGASPFMAAMRGLITDIESGHWDRSEKRLSPVARSAIADGQANSGSMTSALLAWVAAMRGDGPTCHRLAEAVLDAALPRHLALAGAIAQWSVGLLALGEGQIDDAIYHLRDMVAGRSPTAHAAVAVAAVADLMEALVRAGNYAEAWHLLHEFDIGETGLRRRFHGALALRCRALVAGREGGPLFEEALRSTVLPPFETARTHLVYGEWLRRHREVRAARQQLHAALDCFDLLGARPWAARCQAELRAAGHPAGADRERRTSERTALTPRELQIVRSVAAGKTNREVAAELFISPRTVSDHLYKLFPKLGISSRHELRDLRLDLALDDDK